MKITFVCLGNICRSPLAEAIAKDKIKKENLNIAADGFGTASWHIGKAPCKNSQKIALEHNIDISHYKASQITKDNIYDYDIVLGLDASVVSTLKNLRNDGSVLLLGDFGYGGKDIIDTYFHPSMDASCEVYNAIEICITNLFNSKNIKNV